jgi:hypothetical protein
MRAAAAIHRLIWQIVLVLVCALAVSCTKSEQKEEQSNLRLLSVCYGQYRAEHRGQVPANEKDFKAFINAKLNNAPSQSGVSSVDELFVSGRDGKPFVVRYRGDRTWPMPEVNIYEQEGRGGTRHVATVEGGYAEMSEEEFRAKKTASAPPK